MGMSRRDETPMSRRQWLKAAVGIVAGIALTPLVGDAGVVHAGGADGVSGASERNDDREETNDAVGTKKQVSKISRREAIGCVECDACMPCGYGVDIPGNFRFYNDMLAKGMVPDMQQDDVLGSEFREKAVGFLRSYDRAIPDRHQSQRCIKCFHCVNECRHGVYIVNELSELTALTDALRDWECRYL